MKRSIPNLFLVGAPKCGTSSLYRYLSQHPDVFMSPIKEPQHFAVDLRLDPRHRIADRDRYLALFAGAAGRKVVGEASVWHLFSKAAALGIREFSPQAKIIISLREPVSMMYSLHGQFLYSGNEDIVDFEQALLAEVERRQGRRVPSAAHYPGGLAYTEVVSYAEQVRRYFEVFGRDRVHVLLFDDLLADTETAFGRILEFLDLDPRVPIKFQVHNRADSKDLRNLRIRRELKRHPWVANWVARVPTDFRRPISELVAALTGSKLKREKAPDQALRSRYRKLFKPQIEDLGRLIGRDLSHWTEAT
jgi:hypothetical protein